MVDLVELARIERRGDGLTCRHKLACGDDTESSHARSAKVLHCKRNEILCLQVSKTMYVGEYNRH